MLTFIRLRGENERKKTHSRSSLRVTHWISVICDNLYLLLLLTYAVNVDCHLEMFPQCWQMLHLMPPPQGTCYVYPLVISVSLSVATTISRWCDGGVPAPYILLGPRWTVICFAMGWKLTADGLHCKELRSGLRVYACSKKKKSAHPVSNTQWSMLGQQGAIKSTPAIHPIPEKIILSVMSERIVLWQ